MHLGPIFESWVEIIYHDKKAFIFKDGNSSSMFSSHRKVCPTSPLLFSICLEALAINIRENSSIHRLICKYKETNMALYADNIVLLMRDLFSSLTMILQITNCFGCLAGYKINQNKPAILELKITPEVKHLLYLQKRQNSWIGTENTLAVYYLTHFTTYHKVSYH